MEGISVEEAVEFFEKKNIDKIKELNDKKFKIPKKCFQACIDTGDLKFIETIKEMYSENVFDKQNVLSVCEKGNYEIMKWFHFNTCISFGKEAMDISCINGYIENAEWLYHNRLEGCSKTTIDNVMEKGNTRNNVLKILDWMVENGAKFTENSVDIACRTGDMDIINFVLNKLNVEMTFDNFKELVKSKNLTSIITVAFKYNFKFTEEIRDICVSEDVFDLLKIKFADTLDTIKNEDVINSYLKGYTRLVKWIIKKTNIDYKLFDIAACKGDIQFLLWLDSKKFSATTAAMDGCCINGHYLVLKFLSLKRTEGFSEEAVYGALRNNHHDIYTWLYHNYPRVKNSSDMYEKFCKEHGINYPDTTKYF